MKVLATSKSVSKGVEILAKTDSLDLTPATELESFHLSDVWISGTVEIDGNKFNALDVYDKVNGRWVSITGDVAIETVSNFIQDCEADSLEVSSYVARCFSKISKKNSGQSYNVVKFSMEVE